MRSIKTRGLDDLGSFCSRVKKVYAMGRIDKPDHDFLIETAHRLEARVISMHEVNEQGEEEGTW